MAETEFFSENNIRVTNARFVVDSQTFAMSGVTSVDTRVIQASKKGPIILIAISALVLLGGLGSISEGGWMTALIGAGLIALGVYWLRSLKDEYVIFLKSGSGETKALSSTDQAYIRKIVAALNDAIIHRG